MIVLKFKGTVIISKFKGTVIVTKFKGTVIVLSLKGLWSKQGESKGSVPWYKNMQQEGGCGAGGWQLKKLQERRVHGM